jgi:hypothetical protein
MKKIFLLLLLVPVLSFGQDQNIDVYDQEFTDIEITKKVLSNGDLAIHVHARMAIDGNVDRRAIGDVKYIDANGNEQLLFDFITTDQNINNQIANYEFTVHTAVSVPETITVGEALDNLPANAWNYSGYQYTTTYNSGSHTGSAFYVEFDWLNYPQDLFHTGPVEFIIDGRSEKTDGSGDIQGAEYTTTFNLSTFDLVDESSNPRVSIPFPGVSFGECYVEKRISDNGGYIAHFRVLMGREQISDPDPQWDRASVGEITYLKSNGQWKKILDFDQGYSSGGVANISYAGGMIVNLYNSYGAISHTRVVQNENYTFDFLEFDYYPQADEYDDFFTRTVTLNVDNQQKPQSGYNQVDGTVTNYLSFNMEPRLEDFNDVIVESNVDYEMTDNGVVIQSIEGSIAPISIIKALSISVYNQEVLSNTEVITLTNNSHTFDLGPFKDNSFHKCVVYALNVVPVGTEGTPNLRVYELNNIQTLPYIAPSNILAVNDDNGNVNISWTKESSIPTSELIYYVDRGELAADGESIIWNDGDSFNARYVYNGYSGQIINRTNNNLAYTGDDEFGYTDLEADQAKTYIYRIRTAGATDNVYYDGLDGENAIAMGTGAGIEFPTIYLPTDASTKQCGSVKLKWNEVEFNASDFPEFTMNNNDYTWTNEHYIVNSPMFNEGVYGGAEATCTVDLDDDNQFGEQSFLVLTSATRSDGKVFTSFYPTIIKGERIPMPTEVTSFSGASNSSAFTLSWDAFTEDDYVDNIVVSYSSSNGDESHSLSWNETTHDADIASCEEVVFTVTTENCQTSLVDKSSDIKTTSGVYVPDVHNTFIYRDNLIEGEAFKDLEVSAGEFGDRIELFWENNNNSAVNSFDVMRRVVVDDNATSFQKIGETSRDVHAYTDLYADANQLYEYQIQAKFDCTADSSSLSDITSVQPSNKAVGFRAPTSDLFGRVTFDNGSPAKDIIVTANTSDPFLNKSLYFEGGAHIELYDIFQNQTDNSFSIMAWFRPDYTQEGLSALFSRIDSDNGNGLYLVVDHDNQQLKIYDETSNGGLEEVVGTQSIGVVDGWQQLSVTYNHSLETLTIYLNGELVFNHILTESFSNADEFALGIESPIISNSISINSYSGYMDEISIWSVALDDTLIANTYGDYFSNQEANLLAYYHCDEGVGDSIYDISKNEIGIFRKNNSRINQVSFSTNTPSQDQIGYKGLSDDMGYYSVRGIRFNHSGTNFNITPTKSVITALDNDSNLVILEPAHEFTPAVSSAYFGDGIDYLSNYNFTDISSFDVTGHVYYLDPNSSISNMCTDVSGNTYSMYNENLILASCSTEVSLSDGNPVPNIGVEGAALYIDNLPAYDAEGNQIYTDENGAFSIEVPIGRHQISVQKEGHTFVNEVWNSSNHTEIILDENTADAEVRKVYNFTQNLSNLTFYDNTVRTLVGRVCGGTVQANKTYGNEASINNIGQAEFTLKNVGTEVHSIEVFTDEATGEYSVNLLPLQYQIKSDVNSGTLFSIENNVNAKDYFKVDAGNGQPYPFPIVDMREKGNLYNYSQGFYDDIRSIEEINEIGKQMELVAGATDSTQVIADSILVQYYDLINYPNSIYIDNSGNDDYDSFPYLFTSLSHDEVLEYYTPFVYDGAENFVYRSSPTISFYSSTYDPNPDNGISTD